MTILEYSLSDQQKSASLYKVLEAFQFKIVPLSYRKKFKRAYSLYDSRIVGSTFAARKVK